MNEKRVIFTFGRFQPPTKSHGLHFNEMLKIGDGIYPNWDNEFPRDVLVFPSRSENNQERNPLTLREKLFYLNQSFPEIKFIDEPTAIDPFKTLSFLSKMGYNNILFAVGIDRYPDYHFQKIYQYINRFDMPEKSVNTEENFINKFSIVNTGERNYISGTYMRKRVKKGDLFSFLSAVPYQMPIGSALGLYNILRERLGLSQSVSIC
jgi:hypothetical protein